MTNSVSIIIPTKNSSEFLEECLKSVKDQSYRDIEIIVVDNFSKDDTMMIAQKYADQVFQRGPERSAQRNFGVKQAKGKYVLIIDSDMKLSENVVASCIEKIESDKKIKGIIIPEESFGIGFWAKCKKLEKSFYVGVDWMEAARFFEKEIYEKAGGYDENMVSGEDWDLSQRVEQFDKIGRISDLIYHNEGKVSLLKTIKKKFYYASEFAKYVEKNKKRRWLHSGDSPVEPECKPLANRLHSSNKTMEPTSDPANKINKQTGIISRYKLFLSQPKKLFKNPLLGTGMLLMKTCEFAFGGIGYLLGKAKNK